MRDTRVGVHRTPVRSAARFVARHPRLSGSVLVGSAAVFWFGLHTMLWAVGIAVLAGVSWRLLDKPTFDRFAGRLLRAWWRRWWTYQRPWLRIMTACNLTTTDHKGETLVPRVTGVRCTWSWDTVSVRMAKGQAPEDFEQAIERLATAFRARSTNVRLVKPGKLALDFQRREPFDEMVVPLPALTEHVDEVDLRKLVIGRDEYGRDFGLNLLNTDLHILLGGETGAGKGSWLWAILRNLAPLIRTGRARLWVIDPKGGMEFGAGRPMFHRFADNEDDGLAVLREYVDTLDATKLRLGREGTRQAEVSTDTPLEVLLVDELAALTNYGSREVVRAAEPLLLKALTQYRAVLGRVIGATQEPAKDNIPMRGLFPTKIALRLDSPSYVDMCLGEGMRDMGAFADKIPAYLPGVAYVKKDGRREPLRMRAAYTSDEDIAELVRFCTSTEAAVIPLRRDTEADNVARASSAADEVSDVDFTDWEVDDEVEVIPEDEWGEHDEDIA